MRVISICLGLLLATAVFAADADVDPEANPLAPDGDSDALIPPPGEGDEDVKSTTEEPKKPEKVTESTIDSTTTETKTDAPTTPAEDKKISTQCSFNYLCYTYLEDKDGVKDGTYVPGTQENCVDIGNLLNPTAKQRESQCVHLQRVEEINGFVYIKNKNNPGDPWTCCINPIDVCIQKQGEPKTARLDPDNTKQLQTCSKNVQCGPGHLCLEDTSTYNTEYLKDYLKRTDSKVPGDICCHALEEDSYKECDIGTLQFSISDTADSCSHMGGRCKNQNNFGTCIQQKRSPDYSSSCCKLEENDLCPGGLYPLSLKLFGENDQRISSYDIRIDVLSEETYKEARRQKCSGTPFAYMPKEGKFKDNRCCPMGLQKNNLYVQGVLNGTYINTSEKQCDKDDDCGKDEFCTDVKDAVAPDEVQFDGTKKMCFKRLKCPKVQDVFSNLNKGGTGLDCNAAKFPCGEGDICVPFNGNLSVCCPFTAYSKVCVPSIANHPAIKDDGIAIQTQTCENDDTHQRRFVPFEAEDKNNAGPKVKLCCEWKSEQSQNATGKCQNGGSYMLDAKKKVIECTMDKVEEGKPCGEGYRGNCRKEDDGKFFCCNENRCPTDYFTPMNGLVTCEDKNCVWADKGETMKNKYCHADKAGTKRCCPGTVSEDIKEHKIPSHELKGTSCKQPKDCGGGGKYCKDGVCWNFGSNTIPSSSKCFTNEDCDKELKSKRKFYCLIHDKPNDRGVCATHQTVVAAKAKELNTGLVAGCAVCAVMAVIFGLIATVSFLKYRSKNFCDSRKPSKKDKKSKKADKTEGTTGGGETTGTTSKVDTVK